MGNPIADALTAIAASMNTTDGMTVNAAPAASTEQAPVADAAPTSTPPVDTAPGPAFQVPEGYELRKIESAPVAGTVGENGLVNKSGVTSPSDKASTAQLMNMEDVKKMSMNEIVNNWDAVRKVMDPAK